MITQYLVRRIKTQIIEYAIRASNADPVFEGPVDPDNPAPVVLPLCEPGCELIEYAGNANLSGQPTPTSVLEWDGAAPVWVERGDMPAQRAHKAAAISSCCTDAILAGFASSALGEPHTYPAKPNDQINLAGLVMRSFYPSVGPDWARPFWCMDVGHVWAYRMHTAAQIQQVGDDSIDANLIQRGINEQLQAQIIAAETPADLAEINWPSEAP
jgi:hypothetical protein